MHRWVARYCNNCNCNSLFTCFLSHQVSIFTHMHSVHFTAFFYALPIVHDTSSKNAQVSPATTSFPWHHTKSCNNHGYNAVADESGQVSFAKRHFRDVPLNTRKNHGYNAVAEVSCAGSHFVPRILYSLPTKKVKKVEKGQTFSDHS